MRVGLRTSDSFAELRADAWRNLQLEGTHVIESDVRRGWLRSVPGAHTREWAPERLRPGERRRAAGVRHWGTGLE